MSRWSNPNGSEVWVRYLLRGDVAQVPEYVWLRVDDEDFICVAEQLVAEAEVASW